MSKNEGITETLSPPARERCELLRSLLTEPNRPKEAVSVFRNAIPAPSMTDRVGQGGRPVAAARRLAEDLRPVGFATISTKMFSMGHASKLIAQTMFALDIVPPEYTCIICHPTENLERELPALEELSEHGIDVLYDPDGAFGAGGIDISNGAISSDGKKFTVDYSKLGELSASAKRIVRAQTVSACRQLLTRERGSYSPASWMTSTYDTVPATELVADYLSFSNWSFDEMEGWGDLKEADMVADLAAKMGYTVPDRRGFAIFDGLVYQAVYSKFSDLLEIWRHKFAEYGLGKDVLVDVIGNGHAEKLGRRLLVDIDVDAYLSGVPVRDILA